MKIPLKLRFRGIFLFPPVIKLCLNVRAGIKKYQNPEARRICRDFNENPPSPDHANNPLDSKK
jgi:hypothetical protein